MHHIIFDQADEYKTAILVKNNALTKSELIKYYVEPLNKLGVPSKELIAFDVKYDGAKAPVKTIVAYLDKLLPALESIGVDRLYVCDTAYFKKLTGVKKVSGCYGYEYPCTIKGFEHLKVIIGSNYKAVFANPDILDKIKISNDTVAGKMLGTYKELGEGIIHSEYYPKTNADIQAALDSLHQYPELQCDLEAFSLMFDKAGIGTAGFSWDEHNGIAFLVDYVPYVFPKVIDEQTHYGQQRDNTEVKQMLYDFFMKYEGKLTYHNGNYDIKILIYELFMDGLLDQAGLIRGINKLGTNIDDTKIITYLATNSTSGNTLGLKPNAHEFAGNYAENDINDIRLIPPSKLLRYNLVDCLSTCFVKKKYYQSMVDDMQKGIYDDIMIPSVKVLLQIELTGMPLNMDVVLETRTELEAIEKDCKDTLFALPLIQGFIKHLRKKESDACHAKWKKKTMPIEHFDYFEFNPNSNNQVQDLLYRYLDYAVIDTTKSGEPAVGAKTIKKLMFVAKTDEHKTMFDALRGLSEVSIILNTFITAFIEKSVQKEDGMWYLHGNFNLGGTVSGRLSSSKPNMQNIPSTGSKYAKHIKRCFQAPKGWLLVGVDFASLEDRISALTTRDPMKLKVYTDGFDGHCLRAFSYFGDQMEGIDGDDVDSINSIADLYADLRQESKAPTFALTYQGMWKTLVNNLGWSIEKSKDVEFKYHEMYYVSDEWVQEKLVGATEVGYVTVAFGLRVRTPILAKTVLNTSSTPFEAAKEGRTAGNALGQSYGLLNNRASIEFQERTINSDYVLDIRPVAHIHDAQYFLIRDDVKVVEWFNNNLVECMEWQELPEIQHDTVKLGGDMEIFYPSWAEKFTIPNKATCSEIFEIVGN